MIAAAAVAAAVVEAAVVVVVVAVTILGRHMNERTEYYVQGWTSMTCNKGYTKLHAHFWALGSMKLQKHMYLQKHTMKDVQSYIPTLDTGFHVSGSSVRGHTNGISHKD